MLAPLRVIIEILHNTEMHNSYEYRQLFLDSLWFYLVYKSDLLIQ
jgi:hypothetical protein